MSIEELATSGKYGKGSHFQINYLTKDLVQKMHEAGKIVMVWVDTTTPKDIYEENDDFYRRVYDLGVDILTTDYPLRA